MGIESKNEIISEPREPSEDSRISDFYDYAIRRNENLKIISESEIKPFIASLIKEIDSLEETAERDKKKFELPDEIAKNIGAIWVFSGSGTYFEPKKDDRYKDFPWADWMDRTRLDHAVRLTRKIAEKVSGQNFRAPLSKIDQTKDKIKKSISRHGPYIIYNGAPLENKGVAKALTQKGVIIPDEKVKIIEDDIINTIDQIKTFKLPDEFREGKELALIAHAPHLARIIRIINKYKPFPEDTKIRLFPVPTPGAEGKREYAKMEISGTLYFSYITHDATKEPYPYEVSCSSIENYESSSE